MFIPDLNFFHPGSDFFLSRFRIRIKEFKYFNPKKWFLRSRKHDPGCWSRIWILIFYSSRIPDHWSRGSKRHRIPDPDPLHCIICDLYCRKNSAAFGSGCGWRRPLRIPGVTGDLPVVQQRFWNSSLTSLKYLCPVSAEETHKSTCKI